MAKGESGRRPRAVLFDLDGVLIDSYGVWFELMRAAAEKFGAEVPDRDTFDRMWGQGIEADAEYLGCTGAEAEAFFDEHFLDFPDALYVDPAAQDVLDGYRADGIRTCLVTNTPAPLARRILEATELEVDEVVGGTDVEHSKPAPDMPLEGCRRLRLPADQVVFIGDSRYDREAAEAAGIRFIGLRTDGDARVEDLGELPFVDRLPRQARLS